MAPRDALDLPLEVLVDHELLAEHTRQHLDRSVVVSRPEAARDDAKIGFDAETQRCLELLRRVVDDDDPRRRYAQRNQLTGEKRPV